MKDRVHNSPNLIYSIGTQIVSLKQVQGSNGRAAHPAGAVGVVIRSPSDRSHSYRIRFVDGFEAALHHDQLMLLAEYKQGAINDASQVLTTHGLFDRVIYRCIVGSQAYGLATNASDIDRRGIYLPPADLHWSLYGVPEQLENDENQEAYWELQKFLIMALKANPNVLECLYTPLIEHATPLAKELLDMRSAFLSRMIYQTYNGYVMSQFKRMQADIRNHGAVKWKHVMHLIRLLLSGIHALRHGTVPVDVGEHRDAMFAVKSGTMPWDEVEKWRLSLHAEFDKAFEQTTLPERPDYERASDFLVRRSSCCNERCIAMNEIAIDYNKLRRQVDAHPYPLVFATISGAHLYGFPSADSDFDLRGIHLLPLKQVAGLDPGEETVERSGVHDGLEIDLVTHDAKKFFGLMLKKNGYVLEQLLSPLVVHTTPEHDELRAIAKDCITRFHAHHYLGFADTQWRLFRKEDLPRLKPLLYVYRVLLTGIHLMRTGQVEANLLNLNAAERLPYIDDLVARKLAGAEQGRLDAADIAFHEQEYERLVQELESESERSSLPELPTGRTALNDLLVRLRLSGVKSRQY